MENVQIILNNESTLYLLYTRVFWSYISYKLFTYNCYIFFFICNYLKK